MGTWPRLSCQEKMERWGGISDARNQDTGEGKERKPLFLSFLETQQSWLQAGGPRGSQRGTDLLPGNRIAFCDF